jgi:hypothetical protein
MTIFGFVCARDEAAVAEQHFLQVGRGRHHREHDVAPRQLQLVPDNDRTVLGERQRLLARAVPHLHAVAGCLQLLDHRLAHAAEADPSNAGLCRHVRMFLCVVGQPVEYRPLHRAAAARRPRDWPLAAIRHKLPAKPEVLSAPETLKTRHRAGREADPTPRRTTWRRLSRNAQNRRERTQE